MFVLHITSSYHQSKLYKNMFESLSDQGVKQTIYAPLKNLKDSNQNLIDTYKYPDMSLIYSAPFKRWDSYIIFSKVYKLMKDIEDKIDLSEVDLIHAHFLISEGAVAYELKKKYGIKYIVAIRNSDINVFLKYGVHLRRYANRILSEADNIIFISKAYKQNMFEKYIPKKLNNSLEKKSFVLPNGIDKAWFDNKSPGKDVVEVINLIFVGRLDKNKNVEAILNVMDLLEQEGKRTSLEIIGEGPEKKELIEISKKKKLNVKFRGHIDSIDKIKQYYQNSEIFIMPSIHETFGLVYIEAMSQGLPVMYTKNEGIDGYFTNGYVGYSSDPFDYQSMKDNVYKIIENYETLSENAYRLAKEFTWSSVAEKYNQIYTTLKGEK